MPGHDIIVVGTSTGGVEALQILVGGFPCDLPAAIFIVLHVAPTGPSFLDEILTRAGPLPATQGVDGELITPGRIYVAPPDRRIMPAKNYASTRYSGLDQINTANVTQLQPA